MIVFRTPKIIMLLAVIFLLGPFVAAHAQIAAELSVDRTEAFITDEIVMRLTVSGGDDVSDPVLDNVATYFSVLSSRSSIQKQFVNGKFSSSVTFLYRLRPKRAGEFNIGPATVSVDGGTVRTNKVALIVRADAPPAPEAKGPVFAEAGFTTARGYPGQEMIYRLSIYHEPPLADKIGVSLPDVESLTFSPVGDSTEREVMISGRVYGVTEASWAVSASKPGTYIMPPVSLKVAISGQAAQDDDPFGMGIPSNNFPGFMLRQTRLVDIQTKAIKLVINPLPADGRPQDFGGLVGQFGIESFISPSKVKAGEAATLTVVMKGKGNVNLLPDLELKDVDGLKIYPDRPIFNKTQVSDGTRGEKTIKWAIIPQVPGDYAIPAFSFSFLNPATGAYQTKTTSPITLSASEGDRPVAETTTADRKKSSPDHEETPQVRDIQTIHENTGAIISENGGEIKFHLALLMLLLPVAPLVVTVVIRRHSSMSREQARNNRSKKALSAFKGCMKNISPDDAQSVLKALSAYLSTRLGRPGGSITPGEAREMLLSAKVPQELAENVACAITSLETAVFSRNTTAFTAEDLRQLLKTVKIVDKAIRKI